MAKVKILIEGYTTADTVETGEEKTCPTVWTDPQNLDTGLSKIWG